MNVSWSTIYETSNLYLIIGWVFASPVQLTTNTAQQWYQWNVEATSSNASEIYAFLIVDAGGTTDDQWNEGFLSATFWVSGDKSSTSSSMSIVTISTSAMIPEGTSTNEATVTSTNPTADSGDEPGLSEGSRVGVGVGVGVGALGIVALLAAVWFWRRSKKSAGKNADVQQPFVSYNGNPVTYIATPQTYNSSPQVYAGTPQPYDPHAPGGSYKPVEMESEYRGTELDAGQG
ncbi:hypothetical protein F5X99DRAFT_408660 [Biscogniauxia marginata]|nr:hypothetical protein F5X99DRAFT_408660 [Biscogniauxia marginata]